MSRREKTIANPLSIEKVIDIHVRMSAQLLAYMSPEDAFAIVERYLCLVRSTYLSGTMSVDRETILQELLKHNQRS